MMPAGSVRYDCVRCGETDPSGHVAQKSNLMGQGQDQLSSCQSVYLDVLHLRQEACML